MAISHLEAAHVILASPAPVLFIDTCILLDVVRSPYRKNIEAQSSSIFENLIRLSQENPPKIWLVTSETVELEWNNNISAVKLELERETEKLEQSTERFWEALESAGIPSIGKPIGKIPKIANGLESSSSNALKSCLTILPEEKDMARALYRVKRNQPPSNRGKSAKDCEIFEVFLRLCEFLRANKFAKNLVFASSNTSDFGEDNERSIRQELEKFNATLAFQISWAAHEATSAPIKS